MNIVLSFLQKIGLLDKIPEDKPNPGTVLARSVCFLHDGADNPHGFLLFADGYACTTNKCHKDRQFGCNLHGLVRHMAYRLTGEVMPWQQAWQFANANVEQFKDLVAEKVKHGTAKKRSSRVMTWSAQDLAACLEVPDPYYLSRGYRPETLVHFGVGKCVRQLPDDDRGGLLNWSIIPVLDAPHLPPRGYTARNPKWVDGGKMPKWIHKVNRSEYLFNFWYAARRGCQFLFICEGPGCVMRLFEACDTKVTAVATMGADMSDRQLGQIFALTAREQTIFIAADADETGRNFAEKVMAKSRPWYFREYMKVIFPPSGYKDIGDMDTATAREFVEGLLRDR